MYSNLAKTQAFPLGIRFSSQTNCIKQLGTSKPQSLPIRFNSVPVASYNPMIMNSTTRAVKVLNFVKPLKALAGICSDSMELGKIRSFRVRNAVQFCPLVKGRSFSSPDSMEMGKIRSFRVRNAVQFCHLVKGRSFSSSFVKGVGEKSNGKGKRLPWLASYKENGAVGKTSKSTWEESVEKLEKEAKPSAWKETLREAKSERSSGDELDEAKVRRNRESRNRVVKDRKNVGYGRRNESSEEGEEEDVVEDPRWYKVRGEVDARAPREKPEFRRWNKEENWGRKTWKEATESTLPKVVGEGVYGVGPVLAALSAGRREFYALYVQEGLDLSSNNRKKKDKKGFEKVLKLAEKIGLSVKEASKHDLNMISDNRPHQGLVLDASPLEMVKIMELDTVLNEEEKGSVWVALDEVTDPQNLGAIIRSAYFFGASGVVLCAKNSAPLSGVVSKASAGSLELMELRYCKNMMQFLIASAENGWRVVGGSVSSKAVPLREISPGAPTVLVLGSEGTGLRPLVERSCTQLVKIPGNIPLEVAPVEDEDEESNEVNSGSSIEEFRSFLAVESLNVSVAAGVLLHHLTETSNGNNPDLAENQ